jgi:hypothetical protein
MNPLHLHGHAEIKTERTPSGRIRLERNVVHIDRATPVADPYAPPRRPSQPAIVTPFPSPAARSVAAPQIEPALEAAPPRAAWLRRIHVDPMKLNKLVVSSYKVMGFAILGTILFGLASFLFVNLFYLFNHAWVTPMIVSSTDPRVMQLNSQYEAERVARDGVAIQRLQLQSQLDDAKRVEASEAEFQAAFRDVMRAEALDRGAQLAMLRTLTRDLRRTRAEVSANSKAFTAVRRDDLKDEYAAHLIDKDQVTRGGYELSQIAGANLALDEKSVDLHARMAGLQRAVDALRLGKRSTSYEILHMQHELDQSVLASKRAEGAAAALAGSLAMLEKTVESYDAQLARVAKAPYLRAMDASMPTAFVPYDNAGALKLGDAVYACAASVFWCKKIGRIAEILEGEVTGKHPLHGRDLRGVLVRLEITEPKAMERAVLHLQRPPMVL